MKSDRWRRRKYYWHFAPVLGAVIGQCENEDYISAIFGAAQMTDLEPRRVRPWQRSHTWVICVRAVVRFFNQGLIKLKTTHVNAYSHLHLSTNWRDNCGHIAQHNTRLVFHAAGKLSNEIRLRFPQIVAYSIPAFLAFMVVHQVRIRKTYRYYDTLNLTLHVFLVS